MIGDIIERDTKAPQAPTEGPKPSLWKQRRAGKPAEKSGAQTMAPPVAPPTQAEQPQPPLGRETAPQGSNEKLSEDEKIHLKNLQTLNSMNPREIEQAKQQLIESMDPQILQSLLKRAELKEQQFNTRDGSTAPYVPHEQPSPAVAPASAPATDPSRARAPAVFASPAAQTPVPHSDLHFPAPPDDLKKYFPDTPVETAKLAWMQPVAPEEEAEYSSELVSVAPSQLRFDFKGNLLTPRKSAEIDTSVGLHHHADAPGAAGYTIPELAHLARSSNASQRTIAIQMLGRILHKLVNGKFNKSSELQFGLEQLVKSTRIEETLLEAASDKTRSLTVRTHATEALWLYHNQVDKPAEQ